MKDRYLRDDRRKLVEALRAQRMIATTENANATAVAFAAVADVIEYQAGSVLIEQDGNDDHIVFILNGETKIEIHGQEVARRGAECHVGEMSLVDPSAKRSATVTAVKDCTAAIISEADFSAVAAKCCPDIWRFMAQELAERLRERSKQIRPKNQRPKIMFCSSVAGLPVTKAIQNMLAHAGVDLIPWNVNVFELSHVPIEDLEKTFDLADFVVAVITPDDTTEAKGEVMASPRDNVILEIGMALKSVGRDRTMIVAPRSMESKIKRPSDLLGVEYLKYDDEAGDLTTALVTTGNHIEAKISKLKQR